MKPIVHVVTVTLLLPLLLLQVLATPANSFTSQPQEELMLTPVPSTSIARMDDEHFAADSGGHLDQYVDRYDLTDGRLTFYISVTRYFFNVDDDQIAFDGEGFLTDSALAHTLDNDLLPPTATLYLRLYDVDHDSPRACPEVDYLWVNGHPIEQDGEPVILTGANDTWSDYRVEIPIGLVKFPMTKGENLQPPPAADNEIAIEVDALACSYPHWAVQVDWGVLAIAEAPRPILLAHGWRGTTQAFEQFDDWLARDGLPSAGHADLAEGIKPIVATAPLLNNAIFTATQEFGVDRVNVWAHSKGGLVAREAMTTTLGRVERLTTFATPHHGTRVAWNTALAAGCSQFLLESVAKYDQCMEAGRELTVESLRAFNYSADCFDRPYTTPSYPLSGFDGHSPQSYLPITIR